MTMAVEVFRLGPSGPAGSRCLIAHVASGIAKVVEPAASAASPGGPLAATLAVAAVSMGLSCTSAMALSAFVVSAPGR